MINLSKTRLLAVTTFMAIAATMFWPQLPLYAADTETADTVPSAEEIEIETPPVSETIFGRSDTEEETATAALEEAKIYLPEQPDLINFADGNSLDPYSVITWEKVYDRDSGDEANYTVVIINPDTRKAAAYKHTVGNSCRMRAVKGIDDLTDNKEYSLQVIAYKDKATVVPPEKRKTFKFIFDKYPGVKAVSVQYQGRLLEPETKFGLKTAGGILLKWEPNIKNHTWVIRMVKLRPNGARLMGLFTREELPVTEYLLEENIFSPEDEDARIEISISSDENLSTPIQAEFYINNNNLSPYKPVIKTEENHIVEWEGLGDPDSDPVSYKLAIEKYSATASEPELVREVLIHSSGRLDLLDALEREINYRCYVIAEDPSGLATRSDPVFLYLDPPPEQPVIKVKTNRKNLAKARRIIVTHENYDNANRYVYFLRYHLADGTIYPPGQSWLTERPLGREKNRVELALRSPRQQIQKITLVVRVINDVGENADAVAQIMGKVKTR